MSSPESINTTMDGGNGHPRKYRMMLDVEQQQNPELVVTEESRTSRGRQGEIIWIVSLHANGLGPFEAQAGNKKDARDAASRRLLEVLGSNPDDAVPYENSPHESSD